MKSILGATAILGGSSLVTVLAGLVTAKVNAIELGPSGLGLLALLQSVLGIASIVAGFGLATAIVRFGAEAIATEERETLGKYWAAAWMIFWALAVPVAGLLFVFKVQVAEVVTGGAENSGSVAWVALALIFSLAGALYTGLVNAHHRVGLLARLAIYSAVGQTVSTVTIILAFGRRGIPFAILSGSVIVWAVSRWMMTRHIGVFPRASLSQARQVVGSLVSFGGPYALSMLTGTGVQLALPILVLSLFDEAHVGFVRASSAITVTYVAFLLKAMSQDYYPRLSAVSGDHERMGVVTNQQLEVIFLIGVPFVLVAMAIAPVAIPILYSKSFVPAVSIVEWQLVGDLLKFVSWAMAFGILAIGRTGSYMATESVWGLASLIFTYTALRTLGIDGYGIGYALAYALYCLVVYGIVRKSYGFRFSPENARTLWTSIAVILAARLATLAVGTASAYAAVGMVGGLAAVRSGRVVMREWNRGKTQ